MTVYDFKTIVQKARYIKHSVESTYDYTVTSRWCYYICKAILEPGKSFSGFKIAEANNPRGTYISRTVSKADYLDMCRRVVKYVELKKKMPNHVAYRTEYKINIRLFTYIAAYLLVHYVDDRKLKDKVNINSKYFVKPTEPSNKVYDEWVKTFGFKPKYIDDACDYIKDHFNYQLYYDDQKSNSEVIHSKSGNCVDLSQMLSNIADALGYEWKCIHTQCRQSGTGHVYLKLRKGGAWFTRDPACIADESNYCVWCNVDTGAGYELAENPSWWLSNRNR